MSEKYNAKHVFSISQQLRLRLTPRAIDYAKAKFHLGLLNGLVIPESLLLLEGASKARGDEFNVVVGAVKYICRRLRGEVLVIKLGYAKSSKVEYKRYIRDTHNAILETVESLGWTHFSESSRKGTMYLYVSFDLHQINIRISDHAWSISQERLDFNLYPGSMDTVDIVKDRISLLDREMRETGKKTTIHYC